MHNILFLKYLEQMKKAFLFAAATIALASCSSDELVNKSAADTDASIAFGVEAKNLSRSQNFETLERYNFGVWAYKVKGSESQQVMNNYLVGYSDGNGKGYALNGASTWNASAGDVYDHQSPWFYEKLGKAEYKNTDSSKGYLATQTEYMSANDYQYLRYWDLAYTNTNFYAYAPYKASGVSYADGKITVENGAQTAGYSDNSKTEFLYAGATATNANKQDVILHFHHLGAKVNLQFYEDIPGYKVEIIDVTTSGTGIQATPATKSGTTYTKADYYTTCGATITYDGNMEPTAAVSHVDDAANYTQENLKFDVPTTNLTTYTAKVTGTKYNVIPEKVATGTQKYAASPKTYYPVAQPTTSEVGFTFHVSYKIIAEDNGEEITVHDARVYVPAKSGNEFIAAWQPNTAYTYTFKITTNSTGSTATTTPDITDPTVPTDKALYPIVFDGAIVEDYATKNNESDF